MELSGHGISVSVPDGWEAAIYRRPVTVPGATTNPVLHAATFPLPPERGDFGSGAVEQIRSSDAFVALVEYDTEAAGKPLFAKKGPPVPRLDTFGPHKLQRRLPGQVGAQLFFSERDRAFCLYAVLGSLDASGVTKVRELVAAVRIEDA